jgi:hypothetical protein
VVGILDAKYKPLFPSPWNRRGPQREDLYQLASYLSRFNTAKCGILAYPADPNRPGAPWAEVLATSRFGLNSMGCFSGGNEDEVAGYRGNGSMVMLRGKYPKGVQVMELPLPARMILSPRHRCT